MNDTTYHERHYIGKFVLLGEEIDGEIIHNTKTGDIFLNLAKQITQNTFLGKSYADIAIIQGMINTGATVTLFNNRCINNHTRAFQNQRISFSCDYFVWSGRDEKGEMFNALECILKNAYIWSQFEIFETTEHGLKRKEKIESKSFEWFGVNVKFSATSNEHLIMPFDGEEKTIVQRVKLSISSDQKHTIEEFLKIVDRIVAMISFAIKGNVNISELILFDYEDSSYIGEKIENYHKHYLIRAQRELDSFDSKKWDLNFTLNDIAQNMEISAKLEKLTPVFDLYLSLFKYRDMPTEMIFLNIVQALETFHSRFFYDNKKEKYKKSIEERFSKAVIYGTVKSKLWSKAQERAGHIILESRINDLLIGNEWGLFLELWKENSDFVRKVVDTRNYFTHYDASKESKSLKGECLHESIILLSKLLEYHVCLVLGIDNRKKIRDSLDTHYSWKQLGKVQNECKSKGAERKLLESLTIKVVVREGDESNCAPDIGSPRAN